MLDILYINYLVISFQLLLIIIVPIYIEFFFCCGNLDSDDLLHFIFLSVPHPSSLSTDKPTDTPTLFKPSPAFSLIPFSTSKQGNHQE